MRKKKNPWGGGSWLHILGLVQDNVLIRSRDVTRCEIPRARLKETLSTRLVVHVGRGLYAYKDRLEEAKDPLQITRTLAPHAALCTLSAAEWHLLLPGHPDALHLAIDRNKHPIQLPFPTRWFRFSGERATFGITLWRRLDLEILVTTPARTVADLFMLRKHFDPGVGVVALDRYVRRGSDLGDLAAMADLCRVRRLIESALRRLGKTLPPRAD